MNSLDEALPAARTARASVSTVKNRHDDAEGGAAFRKTFADLKHGREAEAATDAPSTQAADPLERSEPVTSAENTGIRKEPRAGASTAAADEKSAHTALGTAPGSPARLSATATLSATLALKAIKADGGAKAGVEPLSGGKTAAELAARASGQIVLEGVPEGSPAADPAASVDSLQATHATTRDGSAASHAMPSIAVDETLRPSRFQLPAAALSAVRAAEAKSGGMPSTGAALTATSSEEDVDAPAAVDARMLHEAKVQGAEERPLKETQPDATDPAAIAAAAAPSPDADLRSLMAILGPVKAATAQDAPARDEPVAAETGTRSAKLAGTRTNLPMPATDAPPSGMPTSTEGTDQVFRFARADGKVVPMTLRPDAERTLPAAAGEQAASKAETVTVLDARRYLGIAPTLGNALPMTANAQAVAAAITGNGDATQSLQANTGLSGAQGGTGKVVNTLKIQMHPIDLGLVTATLRLRDDELQIDLRVRTGEAYRQLSDDQDAMIKALRAQGFQVDQVNVIFTGSDSAGGNDGSSQPQGNQQQPSHNGRDTQSGLAAGNGGEGRNGAGQRNADDGRTRQDTLREASATAQPGSSDELYF
ncbi:hypothetical protein ASG25_05415 [Rhizobium sp. Leaf384]|uniref:flagellar hook-length control protein FliK n=1 Tax=unclassified Rhizobium TaxID=2613769 RepID=UPI0007153DA3|nr:MULTISPECIES: flagellar hook-length control protein FliK [unclassified Rhizobium]KQR77736.1 hypothetical protein ASG03_15250 [Rhizobium sp. Leaf341]KQS80953.1 hypothetical protein ASG25_05415 [Rhizobium sp. Leaf384]KQS86813.1 hypothetical protein ASG58_00715 [Rhizobium sp. Leaf383]